MRPRLVSGALQVRVPHEHIGDQEIVSTKAPRQLFLGNVAYTATEDDIRIALEGLGIQVDTIRIGIDRATGNSRGFAFVDIGPDEPLALDALIQIITGLMICGRPCRADMANKPKAGATPAAAPPRDSGDRPRGRNENTARSSKPGRSRTRGSDFDRPWRDDD